MVGSAKKISPIFFTAEGEWARPRSEFSRGTREVEAHVAAVLFARGHVWEILWEWNGVPHIYERGTWQQRGGLDHWTFRLYADDEPLVPGQYRLTVWCNREVVAQGSFDIRGPRPPQGGDLALGPLALYQFQGRHLTPVGVRAGAADALGATLSYADLPQGAMLHVVWCCDGRLLSVENREWYGPAHGEELLLYTGQLGRGRYELLVCCWPHPPITRRLVL